MVSKIIIRNPDISDYERVLDVMVPWWGGRDLRNKVYKGLFIHFTQTSFIVENKDGELLAFLLGFLSQTHSDEGFINWVGVHPKHRNKGIARVLYERFLEIARNRGRTRITANTSVVNRASMLWHKHMGFTVDKTNESFLFTRNV